MKWNYKHIFIVLLYCSFPIFGQIDTTKSDSVTNNSNTNDLLKSYSLQKTIEENPFYFNNLQYKYDIFIQPFNFDFNADLDYTENSPAPLSIISQMYDKRVEITHALKMQSKWAEERSLGVVGQILGYANAAAAATLLYLHLKKYKKEY